MFIRLLLWIGLVTRRPNGTLRWPVWVAPRWMWRHPIATASCAVRFYVFRNRPGVIKWREGRLLPRRWGFGVCGLVEFGDRG